MVRGNDILEYGIVYIQLKSIDTCHTGSNEQQMNADAL